MISAVEPWELGLLVLTSLLAGTVDAIAGGGGLLTLPALLATGMPAHLALGTNKGQSVFGSFAALVRFARAGMIDWHRARAAFPLGLVGSACGAALVLWVPPAVLRPLVLVLLVTAGAYLLLRRSAPRPREAAQALRVAAHPPDGQAALDAFLPGARPLSLSRPGYPLAPMDCSLPGPPSGTP